MRTVCPKPSPSRALEHTEYRQRDMVSPPHPLGEDVSCLVFGFIQPWLAHRMCANGCIPRRQLEAIENEKTRCDTSSCSESLNLGGIKAENIVTRYSGIRNWLGNETEDSFLLKK